MKVESISRIEAHRRIVQQPVIQQRVIITHRSITYRLMDAIIIITIGLCIGGLVGLLFVGCNNPTAPSPPRRAVRPVPTYTPQP